MEPLIEPPVPPDRLRPISPAVLAALEAAIRERGLPAPRAAVFVNGEPPTLVLHFGMNDTDLVDAWAELVGAKVGFTNWTWGYVDEHGDYIGAPCHEYGTAAEDGVYGTWHRHTVLLTCTVLGPHTISRTADRP